MTNQEWVAEEMKKASAESAYEFMGWLMYEYAKGYTDSRLAVINWLKQEKEGESKEKKPCPCDTCQTAIDRCGCQMHLCSDYQKWKEGK